MTLKRPGFKLPLDYLPAWSRPRAQSTNKSLRFPHAIADFFATAGVTLRENRMLEMINMITDKPRWWEKIRDEDIVASWREEACGDEEQQRCSARHLDMNSFEYCMKELHDKAAYFEKHGVIHVMDSDATIVKKDLPLDDPFWTSLKSAAYILEDVPDRLKDWHPGTDGLVLDLLHPSLFPLKYGQSRVLADRVVPLDTCSEFIGMGEVAPIPEVLENEESFEKQISWGRPSEPMQPWGSYQWLPSDISFRQGCTHIDSYVNSLHPKDHSALYKVLEEAVDKAIPLWNECLSWFHERIRVQPAFELGYACYENGSYPGFPGDPPGQPWVDQEAEDEDDDEDGEDEDGDEEDDSDSNEAWRRKDHWLDWLSHHPEERLLVHPTAGKFTPFEERVAAAGIHRIDLQSEYPNGLQVIFKLANIHLTPEKPAYEGSSWHVEGCLNEHIAATALFYYDSENITENYLAFRQHVDAQAMVMMPAQNEWMAAEDTYGIENETSAVQDLGMVITRPGRLLAFPNVLQHRVDGFKLEDPTKPGHRKILAMFLIDPHIRILSTANVPPQRRDWWAEEVRKVPAFAELPRELFDRIVEAVDDFPISWDAACEARELLMEERGRVTESYNEMLRQDSFSFCEH